MQQQIHEQVSGWFAGRLPEGWFTGAPEVVDVCEAAGKLAVRRTGSNQDVLREALEFCARVCDACAAECEKHDHEHCKLCAQMCRECAEDCRNAALAVTPAFA